MTAVADRAPVALRVARAITITQAVVASVITGIALVFAVTAKYHDDAARRSGHPNQFDGLGFGIGAFFAVLFGVLALAVGAAAVGLCRNRTWGLVTAGVTEGVLLLVAARSALSGLSPDVWLLVVVPSATVLASVLNPKCHAWCRTSALA